MTVLLIVLIPLLGALLPALLSARSRTACAWGAAVPAAAALALTLYDSPRVFHGATLRAAWDWLPAMHLRLSFMLDGLGFLFAVLILGIGLLVILYARYYLSAQEAFGRFYALLLLFMGAMLGLVLSDNVLLLVVFWELTSLVSFLLIGYWYHLPEARRGARMALTVTGLGGLALLAGLLLLGHIAGSFELSVILQSGPAVRASPLYPAALLLIVLGALTKSAQFPFHFWLPSAMTAPTPVSAYLHSATMVKAGVFLLARLFPVLSGTDAWLFLVGGAGLATLLFGAYTALFKHDLKGLLAYSTISHLGLITLLFGMGTPLAAVAGVFHIINHAIFKASLFMAAGIIDHEAGTRDMRKLNGMWKFMPHTAALAMVAAAAMAGVPLLNGFLSKEMFFSETLTLHRLGQWQWLLPTVATLAGIFSVAYSVRFIHDVFFNGEPVDLPRIPHEPPRYMKVPVEVLVALCLLVGIVPNITVAPLLRTAAASTVGGALPYYSLGIWHGFNLPLVMSTLALAGGIAIYAGRHRLFGLHTRLLPRLDGAGVFAAMIDALAAGSGYLMQRLHNGSLQRYLATLLVVVLGAGAVALWGNHVQLLPAAGTRNPPTPMDAVSLSGTAVLALAAAAVVRLHHRRLTAVIILGVVGLVVALGFARLSAPDLALTQLAVEVVTLILMLLALYFLPQSTPRESSTPRRLRDATLALLSGLGAAALTWAMMAVPHHSISRFYLDHSLSGGGGRNVVNVILVDFRGFDTLGEITVLGIAALGVFALLSGLSVARSDAAEGGRKWSGDRHPPMLAVVTQLLLPLALMVSLYLLLRGHNQPGGGFVAGLVTAIALILQHLASGTRWAERRLPLGHRPVLGIGLLIATATAMASWLFGAPLLTSTHGHLHLPLIGDVELASAMVFDLGVYLTVVGAVMLILARLGAVSSDDGASSRTEDPLWKR